MSNRIKSLIKAASIFQGIPGCEDVLEKNAISGSSVVKALKYTGAIGGVGTVGATGYLTGKEKGKEKGLVEGKQQQFAEDINKFRGAARNIYTLGRVHQRTSDAASLRQHFLKGIGNKGSDQKKLEVVNQPKLVKKSEDKMASSVYEAWASGKLETEHIKNLPPIDLEKIATVIMNRRIEGDQRADILWKVLIS